GLHGAGLLVGAQRGSRGFLVAAAGIQGRQARDRPLLLRPHPAAHAGAQGRDRERGRTADGDGRRQLRLVGRVTGWRPRTNANKRVYADAPMETDRANLRLIRTGSLADPAAAASTPPTP